MNGLTISYDIINMVDMGLKVTKCAKYLKAKQYVASAAKIRVLGRWHHSGFHEHLYCTGSH